ncbi:MAG: hypothetical protein JNL17_16270 [Cyclobacteriaceae bacterium]|nr:hypothetical protein [Cyclobacteriaceae bacterium]
MRTLTLITIFFGLTSKLTFGQCDKTKEWGTIAFTDPDTKLEMFFPLIFNFKADTIIAKNANLKKTEEWVSYLVLSSNCSWDNDGLNGNSEYKVKIISSGKTATVKLTAEKGKGTLNILLDDPNYYSPKFNVQRIPKKE